MKLLYLSKMGFTYWVCQGTWFPHISCGEARMRCEEFAGLKLHKTAHFVGFVGFSTKSKKLYTPLQSVWLHAVSEQAVAYLRENTEAKRFTVSQSGGLGVANSRRKAVCGVFLRLRCKKTPQTKGLGLRPKGK
jgi:hypothetical protein